MSSSENDELKYMRNELIKKRKKSYNQKYYLKRKNRQVIDINQEFQDDNSIILPLEQTNHNVIESIDQINEIQEIDDILQANSENDSANKSSDLFEESFVSSDSSNKSSEDLFDNLNDDLIYSDSKVNLKELAISFLILKYKHKLSVAALDDILNLFKLLIPSPNKCPKTSQSLISILDIQCNTIQYDICQKCNNINISNKDKKCLTCLFDDIITFSIFDIIPQVEKLIKNKSYKNQILLANKNKKNNNLISSALDASIYSELPKSKDNELTISFNINTDGAPLIKSRNHSIWPVLGTVVELNQSCREKFENIIIFGIWLHNTKPIDDFFYKSFEQLKSFKEKTISILDYKINFRCQAGLFDLPAKASIAKVKQFNGYFGCINCFHPGRHVRGSHIYPPHDDRDKSYPLKTNNDYNLYSDQADENNILILEQSKKVSIFGFFGKGPLSDIIHIPEQVPFDYMHLILQGHAKWMYTKLFTDSSLEEKFLGKKIPQLNNLLKSIQMPHTIHRKPTQLEEISKWKSSEIKNFLFYQSIPLFLNVLPTNYLYKYLSYFLFVKILYEPIKSEEDLLLAENIIKYYIQSLEDDFSINAYTYTIHAHIHLPNQVRLHGPLHCHSQFFFEGALFNIKNLLHGTKGYINQISSQIFLYKDIKLKFEEITIRDPNLAHFLSNKLSLNNNKETTIFGTIQNILVDNRERKIFLEKFNLDVNYVLKSDRLYIKNKLYHSKSYSRKGKSNSYSISYEINNIKYYADIEYFLEINNKIYAFIKKHNIISNLDVLPISTGFFYETVKKYIFNYFKIIEYTENFDIIEISSIHNRCVIVDNKKNLFVSEITYEFEHD